MNTFLSNVDRVFAEHPTYREGGLARDGTCDCIGMVIAAMIRAGHAAYALKSSNYFARYQIVEMLSDIAESDVFVGMVVFKRRYKNDARYKLPDRDNVGGRYYNGDLTDYYHVGVVTKLVPLEITHCTSGDGINGTTKDYRLGSWSCGGKLKGINYDDYTEEDETMLYENGVKATVNTGKAGTKTWNLRSAPDATDENVIAKVPFGASVIVYETADGWGQVEYNGTRGYMKEEAYAVSSGAGDSSDDTASDDDSGGVPVTLTAAEVAAIKSIAAKL